MLTVPDIDFIGLVFGKKSDPSFRLTDLKWENSQVF
jgi:hypothetical protein